VSGCRQQPACRVPDARGARGKFGIHIITSFSSFSDFNNPMC